MEKVKQYFVSRNAAFLIDRIHVFTESSATVELAAQRLNCEPAHIAKSISFFIKRPMSKEENKAAQRNMAGSPASPNTPATPNGDNGIPTIIVAAGDAKVNNTKVKNYFACKPRMIKRDEVEAAVGYPTGGVCPFGVNANVQVYLDVSLKRFETVYPACGTGNTGIPFTPAELEEYASNFVEWVDVCDGWMETEAAPKAAE